MSDLGNIGFTARAAVCKPSRGAFTLAKQPTSVSVHITGATPTTGGSWTGHAVYLFVGNTLVDISDVDSTGNAYFYDLDDGVYFANQVGTGNAWQITIAGAVVTIVLLATGYTNVTLTAA